MTNHDAREQAISIANSLIDDSSKFKDILDDWKQGFSNGGHNKATKRTSEESDVIWNKALENVSFNEWFSKIHNLLIILYDNFDHKVTKCEVTEESLSKMRYIVQTPIDEVDIDLNTCSDAVFVCFLIRKCMKKGSLPLSMSPNWMALAFKYSNLMTSI